MTWNEWEILFKYILINGRFGEAVRFKNSVGEYLVSKLIPSVSNYYLLIDKLMTSWSYYLLIDKLIILLVFGWIGFCSRFDER